MGLFSMFKKNNNKQLTIEEKKQNYTSVNKNVGQLRKINIKPMEAVNEIKFGMKRDVIHSLWGKTNGFKKTPNSNNLTDDYGFCHIYYDENDCFEAIEIFDKELDIYFEDKLLPKNYSDILKIFKSKFNDIEEDTNGFISKNASLGVYIENDDDIIDAILFGKKDYYN